MALGLCVNVPIGLMALVMRHGCCLLIGRDSDIAAGSRRCLSRRRPGAAGLRPDQCRRPRSSSALKLAAIAARGRRLRDLRTPRATYVRSPAAAGVVAVAAGRRRHSDRSRHHCVDHAGDVPFGPVRPGRVGRAGRTGVAAVPCRQPGRHRRIVARPTAARSAGRGAPCWWASPASRWASLC